MLFKKVAVLVLLQLYRSDLLTYFSNSGLHQFQTFSASLSTLELKYRQLPISVYKAQYQQTLIMPGEL